MTSYSFVYVLLAAAGLLAAATGCSQESAAEVRRDEHSRTAALDRVTAGTPERKTLQIFTTQPGRIEAFQEAPLYSKVSGYVEEVVADIGDRAEEGQVLVRLWVPELHDDVQQREALCAQARAEVQQAMAAIRAAEAARASAQARIAEVRAGTIRAEAEYELAKSEHTRVSGLVDREAVVPQLADEKRSQLGAADAARQEAAARVGLAEAAVAESEAHLVKARADADAAQAALQVAEADLAHAKTMLAYAEIKAPFAGVVTQRRVDTGHYVQSAGGGSPQPLLVVASMDRVRIFADVPELEASLVNPGDPAVVSVQALGGREVEAEVTRTSWAMDASNRSLNAEIDVGNPDGVLRPGMYATARILLEIRENAVTLPMTAILLDGRSASCFCVESGKLVRVPLTLGLQSGTDIEILSGLDGDEMVVLARTDSLHEGQQVEIMQPADGS